MSTPREHYHFSEAPLGEEAAQTPACVYDRHGPGHSKFSQSSVYRSSYDDLRSLLMNKRGNRRPQLSVFAA